jgi:hypothetical protein
MPARQRNDHHLGHQRQAYNLVIRNQDYDSRYDHKSLDYHRHYQQDKRWFDHHCTSHERIGYVLPEYRLVATPY